MIVSYIKNFHLFYWHPLQILWFTWILSIILLHFVHIIN